ncbi:MAG: hypothetical protein HUK22_01615, partial [Thermoguttaceae bacterium]|nr:hypothetical protein [Thermoguttaceae bacterium]
MTAQILYASFFLQTDVGSLVSQNGGAAALVLLFVACAVLGASWIGDEPSDEEAQKFSGRSQSALALFAQIVEKLLAVRADAATEAPEKPDKGARTSEERPPKDALNSVDYWRDDYWNYDFNLDSDPDSDESTDVDEEEAEEEEEPRPTRNDRDPREGFDANPPAENRRNGNYFGAFFESREKSETPEPSTPRWKRILEEKDDDEKPSETPSSAEPARGESSGAADGENENDEELAVWRDDDELEFESFERILEDSNLSDEAKIAALRARIADGEETCRGVLARFLVQIASNARANQEAEAMRALDEAETIAREDAQSGESEALEFLGQTLLQRPLFYLRNRLAPPSMDAANAALANIRYWAADSAESDARRLLATAWLTRGNF